MPKQNTLGLINLFFNLIQAYVSRFVSFTHLVGLEARLAGKTLITIAVLASLCLIFLIFSWFSLEVCLFFYLLTKNFSMVVSAFILFVINLLILIGILFYIKFIKKRLYFPATCHELSRMNFVKRKRGEGA